MHRPFPLASVVLCVTLAACHHQRAAELPAPDAVPAATSVPASVPASPPSTANDTSIREFRGAYTRGFEASWFVPCGAPADDALWWVTLTDDALRQRDSLLKALPFRPTGALAVRWRGTTSARTPAGMMGRGTRYLLVTHVVDVRPLPSEGACLPLGKRT